MMNFNPGGGEEAVTGVRGEGGINFRAVFTGIVDATPLIFNPTKQQLIEIKDVSPAGQQYVYEPKYANAYERDGVQSRLDLLFKIKPNELLVEPDEDGKRKNEYVDDYFFTLSLTISAEDELSKGGTNADGSPKSKKYRFINENLQSTWAESLDVIKGNPAMDWFITDTARIAKRGEVQLYNLLVSLFKMVGTKDNPITGFKLGDNPTETFIDIVNGDVSALNDILDPNSKVFTHFSHDKDNIRKIALMLGVRQSDKTDAEGKPYFNQTVFSNDYVSNPFAKEGRMLPKDTLAAINSDTFKADTQGSFKFQVYDPAKAVEAAIAAIANLDSTTIDISDSDDFGDETYSSVFTDNDFS